MAILYPVAGEAQRQATAAAYERHLKELRQARAKAQTKPLSYRYTAAMRHDPEPASIHTPVKRRFFYKTKKPVTVYDTCILSGRKHDLRPRVECDKSTGDVISRYWTGK